VRADEVELVSTACQVVPNGADADAVRTSAALACFCRLCLSTNVPKGVVGGRCWIARGGGVHWVEPRHTQRRMVKDSILVAVLSVLEVYPRDSCGSDERF
jgi:hypothetical protein